MTAQAFADVLKEPESDVSHARLHGLISAHDFSGSTLPTVAEDYLRVFCDQNVSVVRRRWVGVALVQMLRASADTVEHLRQSPTALHGLGEVILSATEWEQTKVVAGLIMKQSMEQGIEFSKFWISDKVKNSALTFPRENDREWMEQFQGFLDTLSDLALMNPKADPCILYPISLFGSDNLRWSNWDKGAPIATLQNGVLTMIAPNESFQETIFVDIPFSHIHSSHVHRSNLQSSQAQTIHHEPWDIVLMLDFGPWTYRYNTSGRKGTEVRLTFQNQLDAMECQNAINEFRRSKDSGLVQPFQTHAMKSRSSPIYVGRRSPMQTGQITKAKEHSSAPTAYEPVRNESKHRSPSNSSVAKSGRQRSPHELSATKSLENVKGCPSGNQGGDLLSHPSGLSTVHINTFQLELQHEQNDSRPAQRPIIASPKNVRAAHDQEKQQRNTAPSSQKDASDMFNKAISPRGTQRQSGQEQNHLELTRQLDTAAMNDVFNEVGSSVRAESTRPTPKRVTHNKGKLPSVSQATKERAKKQISTKTRTSVVARSKRSSNAKSMKEANSDVDSDEASIYDLPSPMKHPSQSRRIVHATTGTSRGKKAQNKWLPDSDDEYVPEKSLSEPKSKKSATAKRKGAPDIHTDIKRPRKRAKSKAKNDVGGTAVAKSSEKRDADTEHEEQAESARRDKQDELPITKGKSGARQFKNKSRLRSPKKTPVEQIHSPTALKRHPLIGGLLQSANLPGASVAVFKKPTTPFQPPPLPSTPTRSRSRSIIRRPETPIESRERRNGVAPPITSSPLTWNASQERSSRLRRFAVDTEILSSNSKRVPDSPHAESTAISGHADHNDIDSEKREGNEQIEKSNPFSQRRVDGKATSFIRRLTGEDRIEDNQPPKEGSLYVKPVEINESDVSDMEDNILKYASQPLPRPRMSQRKSLSLTQVEQPAQSTLALFSEFDELTLPEKEKQNETHSALCKPQDNATQTSQSYWKTTTTKKQVDAESTISVNDFTTQILAKGSGTNSAVERRSEPNGEMHDSILPAIAQPIEDTRMKNQSQDAAQYQDQEQSQNYDVDVDGDITLIDDDNGEELPELPSKASFVRFHSTPPNPGSSSSHSSTSAALEPSSDPSILTSQAEEMEWEASLGPHQRALHDLLIRASKRVLRHIVDNETAVADVAEIFARDGHHLLNQLLERQESTYSQVFEDMSKKRKSLTAELEGVTRRLAQERKRIKAVV